MTVPTVASSVLQQRDGATDFNSLRGLPQDEGEIDARSLLHLQLDVVALHGLKSRRLDFDRIPARHQGRKSVNARAVGDGLASDVGFHIGRRDRGIGSYGAARIFYFSYYVA